MAQWQKFAVSPSPICHCAAKVGAAKSLFRVSGIQAAVVPAEVVVAMIGIVVAAGDGRDDAPLRSAAVVRVITGSESSLAELLGSRAIPVGSRLVRG